MICLKKRRGIGFILRILAAALAICFLLSISVFAAPSADKAEGEKYPDLGLTCKSAVLMEASTGKILYAKNMDEALPPASVTKVMTLLLIMEEIDSGRLNYTDTVTASANAASMGGSQIFLKEGESMTVEDLLKSVVIASANDAAVALAEHIAGSEEAFVDRMNRRATELGMMATHFENTNGLDDTTQNHVTSAHDIAVMSRELIKHRKIFEYSSIWMDTIRNGSFGLTNTNRLVRFYKGATGLKTGSTSKAKFCISATASRDGMDLICVIMAADTRDIRNEEAKKLLDWGFANYELFTSPAEPLGNIKITGGVEDTSPLEKEAFSMVVKKGDAKKVEARTSLPESVPAPVKKGSAVGSVGYYIGGEKIGEARVISTREIDKISFWQYFCRILRGYFVK